MPTYSVQRTYVSQFGTDYVGLNIQKEGLPLDPDLNAVTVTLTNEGTGMAVFTRPAERAGPGTYETRLTTTETASPGLYTATWYYAVNGVQVAFETYLRVGESAPAYDAMDPDIKALVESVYIRFADLFDSPSGGPNLQTYFQTHFGRNRMAQLTKIAVGRLNTIAQPHGTFTLDEPGPKFPVARWGPLLEQATYCEVIKHLIRSYVEQPEVVGANTVSRVDRRDYMSRWQTVLDMETADLKSQMETFKIANMGLGRSSVLVAGGVYGNLGRGRWPGSAARGRHYQNWTYGGYN